MKSLSEMMEKFSSDKKRLIRKELKNRAGGGDEIKKINRPISLGKRKFS